MIFLSCYASEATIENIKSNIIHFLCYSDHPRELSVKISKTEIKQKGLQSFLGVKKKLHLNVIYWQFADSSGIRLHFDIRMSFIIVQSVAKMHTQRQKGKKSLRRCRLIIFKSLWVLVLLRSWIPHYMYRSVMNVNLKGIYLCHTVVLYEQYFVKKLFSYYGQKRGRGFFAGDIWMNLLVGSVWPHDDCPLLSTYLESGELNAVSMTL